MVQAVSFEKKKLMLKTKLPLRANMILILFMQNAITNIRTYRIIPIQSQNNFSKLI